MGLVNCPCKIVLGIINGVILLAGLALSAAGGLLIALTVNPDLLGNLNSIINDILGGISMVPGAKVGEGDNPVTDDILTLVQPAGVALLVVGLVILALAILGYCGITCFTLLLKVYVGILIVILVAEVVVVAVLFTGVFNDKIQTELQKIIDKNYVGIDDSSLYSIIPNIIMIQFECCGIHGFGDFNTSTSWHKERNITIEGHSQPVTLVTPIACCKTTGNFPTVEVVDEHCATNPMSNTSNLYTGCWQAISDEVSGYRTGIILGCVIAMLAQAALIIVVIVLICLE